MILSFDLGIAIYLLTVHMWTSFTMREKSLVMQTLLKASIPIGHDYRLLRVSALSLWDPVWIGADLKKFWGLFLSTYIN